MFISPDRENTAVADPGCSGGGVGGGGGGEGAIPSGVYYLGFGVTPSGCTGNLPINIKTSMHSSRMCTVRRLTVSGGASRRVTSGGSHPVPLYCGIDATPGMHPSLDAPSPE